MISLALGLAACGTSPSTEVKDNKVQLLSLAPGSFVTLDLTGASTLSRSGTVDPSGAVSFAFDNLVSSPYAVAARAFDREVAPRVALYKGEVASHTFAGDTLNLKLSRLTSDLRVEVSEVPNTVQQLKAVVGGKYVGLLKTGTTATGVLQGIDTGANRLVVVEGRATPGGPVTHRGQVTVPVNEDNAANLAQVVLTAVGSPAPAVPLLTGAASVQRGTPYSLTLNVPAGDADLARIDLDWGDGQTQSVNVSGRSHTGQVSHTFATAPSGGVDVTATVFTTAGVSTSSVPLHVNVIDATTGNVMVTSAEDVTNVTLKVTGVPNTSTRVTAKIRDLALNPLALKPEYLTELVPDGQGGWSAALGLNQTRAFTVTPSVYTAGGPQTGTPVQFTAAADTQTIQIPFTPSGNGVAPSLSLELLDPQNNRPLSGSLNSSVAIRLAVQAHDADNDPLNCELDANGDDIYETSLGDCSSVKTVVQTFTATGPFTRFVPRVRVSDGSHSVRRAAVVTVGRNPNKWVSGYYPLYEANFQSSDKIGFQGLTHLFVGAVMPWAEPRDGNEGNEAESNWVYKGVFDNKYADASVMTEAVSRAHAAGKKAVMMVGGSGGYQYWGLTLALRPARLQDTVSSLLAFVDKHGFDGIDLDYESPGPAMDMDGLTRLAEELRARRPDLLLTFAGNWVNKNTPDLDPWVPHQAHLFDQINMMSYNMGGPNPGWVTWHSSALYDDEANPATPTSVNHTVKAYLGQNGVYKDLGLAIPANKVGIGIGFYGECQRQNYAPRETPSGIWPGNGDGEMAYWRIVSFYGQHPEVQRTLNDLRRWDDLAKAPYLTSLPLGRDAQNRQRHLNNGYSTEQPFNLQDCDFVSYEDAQSITAKGNYVFDQGLGGTIVWTVSQTYIPDIAGVPAPQNGDRNPLLTATRQGFRLP
ncbi:glycoside hydrolase family 18 protein [Deinococcus aquatilis]|uniref:glycoside hydrolase family 18 protein n=1 Tax=Deinococcus aquatilis TaxID=519440 RepID=UPI00146BE720|nr:glycoside hydrolase family 18 protein [Deinococcus aquatilis]